VTLHDASQPLIKIESLVKTYPTGAGPFDALRAIDLATQAYKDVIINKYKTVEE